MNTKPKISTNQIKGLIVSTVIGVGVLSLPSELANAVGLDGWIPIILSGIIMVPIIIIMVKTFDYYPGMNLFEISEIILGPIFSILYQLIFLVYKIVLLAFVSRILGEVVKSFLLIATPIEVIIFTFILTTSYISRCEIDIIGRMGFFIYPIILGLTIFLVLVTLPTVDFTNLLPVFQSNIKSLPKGLKSAFLSFGSIEILLFAIPYAEERHKVLKASLIGVGIITLVYLSIYLMAASQFGIEHLKRLPWATLSLVKEVDLPGLFLENLEGVVMSLWVVVVFGTMAPSYYTAGKILANLTKTKSHELFILPLIPIIYTIALAPQSPIQLTKILGYILDVLGIVIILIMPVIMYMLAYLKMRRANN